ncbi:MAG: putative hydroxypyruvate reductase [Candidatus Cloacimonetes bacterium ADurb.Bin211]|nr:MAG: putative hydroxypyruvate reductase [Candidatus Cloacimonetes bacterium ADurb.Bin211]
MDSFHFTIYQNYLKVMHKFCQYPELVKQLEKGKFSSNTKVLAIGKTAWKMASLCAKILAQKNISYEGFVLTKYGLTYGPILGITVLEAGHPLPDVNSFSHSKTIVNWLKNSSPKDDLIILLSGGTSALFEIPEEGISEQKLIETYKQLLKSGKNIEEINKERSKYSRVKNGKALSFVQAKKIKIFAVSDVPDNNPHILGSAPFTPDMVDIKVKNGWNYKYENKDIRYRIVADNNSFCTNLSDEFKSAGFYVFQDYQFYTYSINKMVNILTNILGSSSEQTLKIHPFIFIAGGELSVKVTGNGSGGRCSHLVLNMINPLSRFPNSALFCFATDGCDNVVGSGGAWADSYTRKEILDAKISITRTRKEFDSYTALKSINHILPAPILATNVNDVYVLSCGYSISHQNEI